MKKTLLFSFIAGFTFIAKSQNNNNRSFYWQQHIDYKMEVNMDVENYRYKGKQELIYTNNSPDTLKKVYYHLYPNAFQPGSEMDIRLKNIADPDKRMVNTITIDDKKIKESKISTLKPNETGYLKITNFKQNGIVATTKVVGTLLET